MEQAGSPRAATFIVRLWVESDEGPKRTWRGQVEHVQSGEKRYVRELAQVARFIEEHCGDWVADEKRSGVR